jgi:hypothetical protein
MRIYLPCTALGLALAAATSSAQAQTVLYQQPVVAMPAPATVVMQPVQTVRTVTTVRTIQPRARHRAVVTTRRTYVTTSSVVPAATTVAPAPTVAMTPGRLYDYVADYDSDYAAPAPAPVATTPYYSRPLYDTVVTTPAPVAPAAVAVPAAVPITVGTSVAYYRYQYLPDRILVIDPNTGIVVQTILR